MEYRHLGKAGIRVSEISLGTWETFGTRVNEEEAQTIIKAAMDSGINFIDNADVYNYGKAEQITGKAIRDLGLRRQDLVLSSKVYWPMSSNVNDGGLSRKHIMESAEGSLRRLGTEYLDIYLCHHPDEGTPVEEIVRAMDDLVRQGKILYWGTGLLRAHQIVETAWTARLANAHRPQAEQTHYCMLCEDREIKEEILLVYKRYGIGVMMFSPLAQGVLTGKYNHKVPKESRGAHYQWAGKELEKRVAKVRRLTALAAEAELEMAQMALAWILRRPEVSTTITGATKPEHVRSNALAAGERLSNDVLREIDKILEDNSEPQTFIEQK